MKMTIKEYLVKVERINKELRDLDLCSRYYVKVYDITIHKSYSLFHVSDLDVIKDIYTTSFCDLLFENEFIKEEIYNINGNEIYIDVKEN